MNGFRTRCRSCRFIPWNTGMNRYLQTWINGWVNNRAAGDLRRYCAHYDVTIMIMIYTTISFRNKFMQFGLIRTPLVNYNNRWWNRLYLHICFVFGYFIVNPSIYIQRCFVYGFFNFFICIIYVIESNFDIYLIIIQSIFSDSEIIQAQCLSSIWMYLRWS